MADDFPETTWGMVSRIKDPQRVEWRTGIETLCKRYWNPIRSYARAAWATQKNDDDANDLTQEFFLWLIEGGEALAKFDPSLGSFRNYLKGLLRNFGRNAAQAERRLKRGGGRKRLTMSEAGDAPEVAQDDARLAAAEQAFDEAWKKEVLARAVEKLRERHATGRHATKWQVFELYDLAAAEGRPTYAELAKRFGLKEKDINNHLYAMREKLRTEIRAELADTVATPRALEEEWGRIVGF
jgi:RNA polymerase sigma factor (sigma-70 family)